MRAEDYTRWGLPEGAKARLGKGWPSGNITYSPDGTRLAVISSIGIWLYDVATHQEVALLTGHTGAVLGVAFSPDGGTIASSATEEDIVRLWDAVTGEEKAILMGHTDRVTSVAFSLDGGTIASGSNDGTVRLWDVVTGEEKATLTGHTNGVNSVVFSPAGGTLASSGAWDGTVLLWELAPPEPPQPKGDVNGDGVVDINDLIQVASSIGNIGQAPQAQPLVLTTITPVDVQLPKQKR